MPTDMQAGVYSAVRHYLASALDAGSTEIPVVTARMRARPVEDAFCQGGTVRADGRMLHDTYLVQAKAPRESSGPWDLFAVRATLPGDAVVRPLGEGGCKLP